MKKTFLFGALVAILMGGGLVSCKPDLGPQDDNTPPAGTTPGDDAGDGETTRTFRILGAEGQDVTSLEFSEETPSHTLSVEANFQWSLALDQFPGWIEAPAAAVEGELDETTGLYKASLTLTVDEETIADFYESKTATMTFTAADDLEWSVTLTLNHTFEAPAAPAGVLSSTLGTTITIDTEGNIKGANGKTLDFTLTAGEGETDFKAFNAAIIDYGGGVELLACSTGTYTPGNWFSLTAGADNKYTLTIANYPAKYTMGGSERSTLKAYLLFLPSSVWDTFVGPPSFDVKNPAKSDWFMAASGTLFDKYGDYGEANSVMPDYEKYVITIIVEQPEA